MIVEDEVVLAMGLSDLLEEKGYTVIGTANNGPRSLLLGPIFTSIEELSL